MDAMDKGALMTAAPTSSSVIPATESLLLPLTRLELHLIALLAARDGIDGEAWVRRMVERGIRGEIEGESQGRS